MISKELQQLEGKIYMIDNKLNIQYTGLQNKNKDIHNTILNGEYEI